MTLQETLHLFWRAGFGPDPTQVPRLVQMSRAGAVDLLFQDAQDYSPMDRAEMPASMRWRKQMRNNPEDKKAVRKFSLEQLGDMNIQALNEFAFSRAQLREKMFLFWHDHFACFVPFAYMLQLHINKLKAEALGNYRTMLHTVAKDAAMLEFLNNTQNRARKPNENFAREVLELYTLGIGQYTEQDIKEAARAFTGWNYDDAGAFWLVERWHDTGTKTFRGKSGSFGGEDILNMVLDDPATAAFLAKKLYAWFVSDQPHTEREKEIAEVLYSSGYAIDQTMRHVFMSDWFYDPKVMGNRIKSPADLLTGFRRQVGLTFKDEQVLFALQRILGQTVGHPPNVAGWKDGRAWIDASTLVFRMRLGEALLSNSDLELQTRELPEQPNYGKMDKLQTELSLQHFYELCAGLSDTELTEFICGVTAVPQNKLHARIRPVQAAWPLENKVQHVLLETVRSPEYQLC